MNDVSLARERTALAWSRTALGAVVVGGLLVRVSERGGVPLVGAIGGAAALFVAAFVWRRGHATRRRPAALAPSLRALSAAVCLLAALSVVLALVTTAR